VEDHAAHELHVEVPHIENTPPGFADDGECFDENVIDAGTIGDALAELDCLFPQLLVPQLLDSRLERGDLCDERAKPLYLSFVLGTDYLRE
jgi:hypothetical protein